jgi:hypothetical protein
MPEVTVSPKPDVRMSASRTRRCRRMQDMTVPAKPDVRVSAKPDVTVPAKLDFTVSGSRT